MAKSRHKSVKFSQEEMEYELPAGIDFSKLRHVGNGTETVRRLLERSKRVVGLDPDVAKAFGTDDEINEALRLVQRMRELGKPRSQTTAKRKQPA